VSKIITAWHKRLKYGRSEWQPPHYVGGGQGVTDPSNTTDYFDTLPGRDGLAEQTQTSFDSARVLAIVPKLPRAQRIVLRALFWFRRGDTMRITAYCEEASTHTVQDLIGDFFLLENDNFRDRAYAALQILAHGQNLANHNR
jgi:hypothetical protein